VPWRRQIEQLQSVICVGASATWILITPQ